MQVVKEFYNGELTFDNLSGELNIKKIHTEGRTLWIDFQEIINTQFRGGNLGDEFMIFKDYLSLGAYSKAPCGGFVNFFRLVVDGESLVLFSGVNEVSNSHYIVTIHKLLKE